MQGTVAGSASWCTNVGNERGKVLVSVLTESEGLECLRPMATAIIQRFAWKCYCYVSYAVYITSLHSGTRKPSRILRSCCTQTGIAALSLGHLSVHSCLQSGITCKYVSRYFDPSIMMMQLAGEARCMALHAKACTWLQHRVPPPLWSVYVSPVKSNFWVGQWGL